MVAGTYFTLSSSVEKNSEDIEAINQNTINPVEFDYKDKLIRSTIEKIESDVSTVKEDVNEIKESLSKIDERLYEIRKN